MGIALLVALVWVVIRWAPDRLADTDKLSADKAAEERGRVRTALLQLLVGVVAVATAIFTGLTYWLSRRGQIVDRFTSAVDQLGNSAIDVRLGGIYALERLAYESPAYRGPIIQVLAAYIREHAGDRQSASGESRLQGIAARFGRTDGPHARSDESRDAPVDVKAAVAVLARRDTSLEREPPLFNLERTNLRGIRAEGIHFQGAVLTRANLEDARLQGAQLQSVTLVEANLQRAQFADADLTGASLANARLEGAHLDEARGLESATLRGAHYDRLTTRFPPDFKPDDRGAKRVRLTAASADPAS